MDFCFKHTGKGLLPPLFQMFFMYFKVLNPAYWWLYHTVKNPSPLLWAALGNKAVKLFSGYTTLPTTWKIKLKENLISVTEHPDMIHGVLMSCLIKINPIQKYQWGSWHNSIPFPCQKATVKNSPIHFFQLQWAFLFTIHTHTYAKDLKRLHLRWNAKCQNWITKRNKSRDYLLQKSVSFSRTCKEQNLPGDSKWQILIS